MELRAYQNECIESVRNSLNGGRKRVACILPTGSGKTVIFGSIVQRYLTKNLHARVAIVSHLGLLVDQSGDRFKDDWGIATGVLQSSRMPHRNDRCILTTMQSFCKRNKVEKWAGSLGRYTRDLSILNLNLIIIDEGHRMGSESYNKILEMFPDAYVIAFTATPFKSNKLMTNQFDEIAYTTSMQDMIDQGFLVPPRLMHTPFNTLDEEDMFTKILQIYNEHHKGQKAVVYCKSIDEAKLLRNVFVAAGITSEAVTSQFVGEARRVLLKDYREGKGPDILTTVDVLTAGFDSPNLMAIFMPHKVGSVTDYLQRVGRGLRPFKDKVDCAIYVGSDSPGIDKGFWEAITDKILNAGKKSYDNMLDDLDLAEGVMQEQEYIWTKEVVRMAKEIQKKGMQTIAEMIIQKQFPRDLVDFMKDNNLTVTGRKNSTPASKAQRDYLWSRNLFQEGMTKREASALITANKKKNGEWSPKVSETVQLGKYKGKHYNEVPWAYWSYLKKVYPHSPALKEFNTYRVTIGESRV